MTEQRLPSPEAASSASPPEREAKPKRCHVPAPKPVAKSDPERDTGTCMDHRAVERRLRPVLAKRFHHTVDGSTVEVSFGCDPVTFDPEEIVIERGSGHGGYLALWWLRRENETDDFDVTGFVHEERWAPYDHYDYQMADRFVAKTARGRLPAAAVIKALVSARPALTVQFREIEPPRQPNSLHGFSASTSSNDFHAALRVSDGGSFLERRFTGYESSGEQERYLGVQLALESVWPLLEKIEPVDAAPDEKERAFFVKRVLAISPTFYDQFVWWVRARYLRLAGRMGTPELVPLLLEDLRRQLAEVDKAPEKERDEQALNLLADSINAVVRLTGFDPRYSSDKKPRPAQDVARELVQECSP